MSGTVGSTEINWNGVSYIAMMITAALMIVVGIIFMNSENLMFSIPVLAMSIAYLRNRKRIVTISPKVCGLLILAMLLACASDYASREMDVLIFFVDCLLGLILALTGIIVVKTMLRNAPELDRGRPFFITFCGFCISVTLCEILIISDVVITNNFAEIPSINEARALHMIEGSVIGSLIGCFLYYANSKTGAFGKKFDELVSTNISAEDEVYRRNSILELIAQGESFTLEFKSTLRTNLATGEKDARMEKAVLKTIVAFLNSRGGTLLIGVTDAGETPGADVDSFDGSRDKMLLHLNHLIENRIGREYLPFVNYFIVDFDGAPVIRVDCKMSDSPVFLIDGKEQTFFVRSGPSSIDLHGMDLLRYANHNFGRVIKRSRIPGGNQ